MFRNKFIYIIIFLISFSAFSQVNFTTKLSKNQLGLNERVKVEFSVDKDGDNFIPPTFENFRIVGGPSQSIRNSWINGKRSYSKTYSYFLSPIEKGSFEIGQASIEVDGEIYKTLPVKIIVISAVDKPTNPNDPNYIADKKIHLVAELSDNTPFLNEAVSVIYKLYVAPDTGVDNWRELEAPRYANFWSNNIDIKSLNVQNGTYKGEPYRYVVLRRTLLYPQKTGKLKIEPLTLDISVQVPSNRRDFFGNLISSSVNKTVSSGSSIIDVKPLPLNNKPMDFSGAVGNFNFEIKSDKKELLLDEAFQLSLIVSGKGNFNLFDDPKISLPASLEVYEPEKISNVSVRSNGIKGKINNKYTIVPNNPGKYTIPQTKFSFFDPGLEEYKTIYSDPIFIDVEGVYKPSLDSEDNSENIKTNKIQLSESQFSSFKTKTKFSKVNEGIFFNSIFYWILLIAPLIICFIIIVVSKFIRNYNSKKIDELKLARNKINKLLDESKVLIGNKEKFYESIDKALTIYLKTKLKIKNSDFKNEVIQINLEQMNVEKNTIDLLFEIFENCQLARYTPLNIDAMSDDYYKTKRFIEQLEKY
ncbi:MAG: BatD protein [Flavobacteriaceae bacterium]|nr:BatD protein [Flavobacteriaceae bacterium]|tara:strand:+ start:261 stop:2018 length:1758 start_codon:yes stop_codon:yes gene_type:complete